jgi:hypothetical protein
MNQMHITKTAEIRYHAVVENAYTHIDEDVNDLQLRGMIHWRTLIGTTCDKALSLLSRQPIGYEMTITYE